MSISVDLNCDMGESFGIYKLGYDDEVIKLISSVNIACGFHGGDPDVMDKTVYLAKKYNVGVGAHPSYPDLLGFGRWNMEIPPRTLKNIIVYQIGALDVFCRKHGVKMQHVKPHGNLNNQADSDAEIAHVIVESVRSIDVDLPLFVKPNSQLEKVARELNQPYILELFADRMYNDDLSLVSREEEGAIITSAERAAENVIRMVKQQKIITITGKEIDVKGESICVHGDTPKSLDMIKTIRQKLEEQSVSIKFPKDKFPTNKYEYMG